MVSKYWIMVTTMTLVVVCSDRDTVLSKTDQFEVLLSFVLIPKYNYTICD
jgi:hypothetical protein